MAFGDCKSVSGCFASNAAGSLIGNGLGAGLSKGLGMLGRALGKNADELPVGAAVKKCLENCFAEGTLVSTAEGLVPIEQVEVGDQVTSFDEETGEEHLAEVIALHHRDVEELWILYAGGETIETTDEHPFYVAGQGWTETKNLRAGDILIATSGNRLALERVERREQTARVYNFEVRDLHTYLVGRVGAVVHNCSLSPSTRELAEAHITGSDKAVLGHFPGYIEKAKATGASYYDIGSAWDALSDAERWGANRHFLDKVADAGKQFLLSLPKSKIKPGSWLEREVKYLLEAKGYKWINQWSLRRH
jgi:hypothetical protein